MSMIPGMSRRDWLQCCGAAAVRSAWQRCWRMTDMRRRLRIRWLPAPRSLPRRPSMSCILHEWRAEPCRYLRPKPLLTEYHGKTLPTPNLRTERKTGHAMGSPFAFRKYGEAGIESQRLFARRLRHIDDIAVIRSMYADVPNHEPSLLMMNCGDGRLPRPAWERGFPMPSARKTATCRGSS